MLRSLFLKTLRDRRRALMGWAIGLGAFALFSLALYPSVRESAADLRKLAQDLPKEILALVGGEIDFASGAGYLHSRLFAFLAPLLLMIFAIGFGARTIAGEEQQGSLELVLGTPVPRRRIVAEKLAALVVSSFALGTVLLIVLAFGSDAWDVGVPTARIGAAVLAAVLLALTFATLALAVGCAFGRRGVASAAAVVSAVVTYLLESFGSVAESIEPARFLSPWHYYQSADVLRAGLEPGNLLVLTGLILAFSTTAILAFDRRDVGT